MRVLMVSWDYPPHAATAPASHVAGLSEALANAGHDVVVLTVADRGVAPPRQLHSRPGDAPDPAPSVRAVYAEPDLPWLPATRPIARVASANLAMARIGATLARDLDGWVPDVVHAHDWRAGWAADVVAAQHAAPLVLTIHGTERLRRGGNLPPGVATDINSIEWWLLFRADVVTASTRYLVDHLVSEFELDPERVIQVPNGIDLARWRRVPHVDEPSAVSPHPDTAAGGDGVPAADDQQPDAAPPHDVFAWGRVQYEKGFQLLGPAMHILRGTLPGVTCTIAGRGSYLPELQSSVDVEGVSDIVDFVGYLSHDQLRSHLQQAACAVVPSLYEPFGIVALEALAAGAPVVLARSGGLAELVEGTGAALLFEPGNAIDLAESIRRVLTDRDLAAELVRNATELVRERHSWEAIARHTVAVYDAALR